MVESLFFAVAAVIYILRFSRVREFKNDNGDLEGVIVDGDTVVRMDLFPTPVLAIMSVSTWLRFLMARGKFQLSVFRGGGVLYNYVYRKQIKKCTASKNISLLTTYYWWEPC